MTPKEKQWIDKATYEELLERWRFAPPGTAWFIGETGKYYESIMQRKREEIGPNQAAAASKRIGWEQR